MTTENARFRAIYTATARTPHWEKGEVREIDLKDAEEVRERLLNQVAPWPADVKAGKRARWPFVGTVDVVDLTSGELVSEVDFKSLKVPVKGTLGVTLYIVRGYFPGGEEFHHHYTQQNAHEPCPPDEARDLLETHRDALDAEEREALSKAQKARAALKEAQDRIDAIQNFRRVIHQNKIYDPLED